MAIFILSLFTSTVPLVHCLSSVFPFLLYLEYVVLYVVYHTSFLILNPLLSLFLFSCLHVPYLSLLLPLSFPFHFPLHCFTVAFPFHFSSSLSLFYPFTFLFPLLSLSLHFSVPLLFPVLFHFSFMFLLSIFPLVFFLPLPL